MAFKAIVRALYAYTAEAEDELGFAENDVLAVVGDGSEDANDADNDWYTASLISNPDVTGLIPKTYVEPVTRSGPTH